MRGGRGAQGAGLRQTARRRGDPCRCPGRYSGAPGRYRRGAGVVPCVQPREPELRRGDPVPQPPRCAGCGGRSRGDGAGVAENGCRGNARADAAGGCRRGAEPQGRACRVLCQEGQVAG
ncbi:MAG: hypothetical protein EP144_07550 [Alistipes sp.]|nr:hypothetical protein [Alistipes sp.]